MDDTLKKIFEKLNSMSEEDFKKELEAAKDAPITKIIEDLFKRAEEENSLQGDRWGRWWREPGSHCDPTLGPDRPHL
jgi:hypothetical protein